MRSRMLLVTILLFAELALSMTAGMLGGGLAARIGMIAALALPLLFLRGAPAGTPPLRFAIRDRRTLPYLLLLPVFVLLTAAVALGWEALCTLIGYPVKGATPMPTVALALLFDALLPAILEELLCRGALFSLLRPMGRWAAVGGSALLFALMHANVAQIPYALAAGVLLALLYEVTGSLLFPMLFHLANNLLSLALHFGLSTAHFFLIVGGLTCLALPILILLFLKNRITSPKKEPLRPFLKEFFLSPLLLWIAVILAITLL